MPGPPGPPGPPGLPGSQGIQGPAGGGAGDQGAQTLWTELPGYYTPYLDISNGGDTITTLYVAGSNGPQIAGFTRPESGRSGHLTIYIDEDGFQTRFLHDDGAAPAGIATIWTPTSADVDLPAGSIVNLIYGAIWDRWRFASWNQIANVAMGF